MAFDAAHHCSISRLSYLNFLSRYLPSSFLCDCFFHVLIFCRAVRCLHFFVIDLCAASFLWDRRALEWVRSRTQNTKQSIERACECLMTDICNIACLAALGKLIVMFLFFIHPLNINISNTPSLQKTETASEGDGGGHVRHLVLCHFVCSVAFGPILFMRVLSNILSAFCFHFLSQQH